MITIEMNGDFVGTIEWWEEDSFFIFFWEGDKLITEMCNDFPSMDEAHHMLLALMAFYNEGHYA